MRLKPDVGSVVGPSDETHWGQTIFSPAAYGVVEVTKVGAQAYGVSLLTRISERFKDPPVSLAALEQFAHSLLTTEVDTIILLVPVGNIAYITIVGKGAVYLKRGNTISALLKGSGSISGSLAAGDTLVLASSSMVSAVPEASLVGMFDHLTAIEAAEKLTLFLHEAKSDVGAAALIFQVSEIKTEPDRPRVATARPIMARIRFPRIHIRMRKLSVITIVLLFVFLVSVTSGVVKKIRDSTSRDVSKVMIEATHLFDEGVALLDLNPVKGRERLGEAKEILEPYREDKRVADLYSRVMDNLTLAMHSVRAEPELFFDASLIKSGGSAQSLSLFEDLLGIFDAVNHSVYTLEVSTKKSTVIGGGEAVASGEHIAVYGDNAYISTDTGIAQVRTSDNKTTANFITKADQWGTISSVVAYGGNLYLLDTEKSRIWKYVATEKGFSEIREYLNPDSLPDLSKATSMAIDGSVWVSTSDGKVLRFTQGKEQTFLVQGVEPSLGQSLTVYTSDESKNVYILDRDNKRVVVLDKDGLYLAQYLWEGNVVPTQMVVSEKVKKILLLSEGKIFSLEIK